MLIFRCTGIIILTVRLIDRRKQMKNGKFKKLLAMVLAMSFLLSLGLTAAFADGEGDEGVE